tara:strand:- start:534 stop:695 length:162 start_codon:yes stop_codon:yes gene_type:complete
MRNWNDLWEVKCYDGVFYCLENGTGIQRKFSNENKFDKDYFVKWAKQLNEETA